MPPQAIIHIVGLAVCRASSVLVGPRDRAVEGHMVLVRI